MKKSVKYILAVLGAILAFFLLKTVWNGYSSTAAPDMQVQKVQCLAECRKSNLSNNCDQYCIDKVIEK